MRLLTLLLLLVLLPSLSLADDTGFEYKNGSVNIDATNSVNLCSGTGNVTLSTDCTGGGTTSTATLNNGTLTVPSGLVISGSGTLALQEATAGTKCMGTATANGTTAVVISTTCAKTGSRVLLTRSSAPSGTADCWWDTLVADTSFNLDCSGAETGTFNWFVINEAP